MLPLADMKVEILKPARLNGVEINEGAVVELDEGLFSVWNNAGIAKAAGGKETSNGDKLPEGVKDETEMEKVEKMTVDELKIYCEGKKIDLSGCKKKDDIVEKIKEFQAQKPDEQ